MGKKSKPREVTKNATAPYNFVPLSKTVVSAPGEPPAFDSYDHQRYTGYLELDIEALTPLYIRDTYTLEEDRRKQEEKEKEKGKNGENSNFFSPGGVKAIPGSSLRGMVRTLLEIVSYSRMEFVDDKRFYYRKVAVKGRYQRLMLKRGRGGKLVPKTKAGWLIKERGRERCFIYPCEEQQIYKIRAIWDENQEKWEVNFENGKTEYFRKYSFHPVSFIPDPKYKDRIKKLTYGHEMAQFDKGYRKGYLILSGNVETKKYLHPVIHVAKFKPKERIEVPENVIEDYKNDSNRDEKIDLLKMVQEEKKAVPCFYLENNKGSIMAIGHTPLFRLRYRYSVKDHLSSWPEETKETDLAKAIFGDSTNYAGRVFFEDALMVKDKGQYKECSPKVLSSPKPTRIQHYLIQNDKEKVRDWGEQPTDEGNLRGYKLYWHRKTPEKCSYGWIASDKDVKEHPDQYTIMQPVKERCQYRGRIRFENLSDIELGALLFVVDLPPGCAHKIGMGKPLGLGSVKINPTLVITDRSGTYEGKPGRYGKLFENRKWHLPTPDASIEDFKEKFSRYILKQLDDTDNGDLWKTLRLNELKALLYYDEEKIGTFNWLSLTQYIELEKFSEWSALDSPSGVLERVGIKLLDNSEEEEE